MSRELKKVAKKLKLKNKNKDQNASCMKQRVRWTADLHEAFLKAIHELHRLKKMVSPIAIMRVMNQNAGTAQGKKKFQLTRVHVASHLQKYRSDMKCKQFAVGQPLPDFLVPPPRRGGVVAKSKIIKAEAQAQAQAQAQEKRAQQLQHKQQKDVEEDEEEDEEEYEEDYEGELEEEEEEEIEETERQPLPMPSFEMPRHSLEEHQERPAHSPTNARSSSPPTADDAGSFDTTRTASPSPVREIVLGQPFVAFVEQDYQQQYPTQWTYENVYFNDAGYNEDYTFEFSTPSAGYYTQTQPNQYSYLYNSWQLSQFTPVSMAAPVTSATSSSSTSPSPCLASASAWHSNSCCSACSRSL
eukprot:TRINITY_DN2440_c0_g1_i1.p1 TRINITY_DN2440_c0_g1~~TRINITY_DN2440_c0_g1_i1.p1  ORF type:complete len:356 (+),score=85.01 TRINITY_DN2440_c0_g1_i1:189-1256(+)